MKYFKKFLAMVIIPSKNISICLTLILLPTESGADPLAIISTPEVTIAQSANDLDNLLLKLKVGGKIHNTEGLGAQNVFAQKALMDGIKLFHKAEYLSAIRELTNYQNLTQIPVGIQHLTSMQKLAISYEKIGQPRKAIKAYMNYLSSFVAQKDQDFDQMRDVLLHLLSLASKYDTSKRKDIGRLLSSIASLSLPSKIRPEILYLSAKSAAQSGEGRLAKNWLEDVSSSKESSSKLHSRTLYFRALIEISARRWNSAAKLLSQAVLVHQDDSDDSRELSRLALARIAVHQGKPKLAISYYEAIQDSTGSYQHALFESIYLYLNVGDAGAAKAKSLLFLSKYPNTSESYQLKTLLAYLSLKSGDISTAKQEVESSSGKLVELSEWVTRRFSGERKIDGSDISQLVAKAGLEGVQSPLVKLSHENFVAISALRRQLASIKGELRDLLFAMGRSTAVSFRPEWVNRSNYLDSISKQALEVGHKMIAAERVLYKESLTPAQLQKLIGSEKRRTLLLSAQAKMRREKSRWGSLANILGLTQLVAKKHEILRVASARLASARYIKHQGIKSHNEVSQDKISRLQKRVDLMQESLSRALELLRMQRVHEILTQSPHRPQMKFLSQYAMLIDEEIYVLDDMRGSRVKTSSRLLAEDSQQIWKKWKFVIQKIFSQYHNLEVEIKSGINSTLASMDKAEDTYTDLTDQIDKIYDQQVSYLGQSSGLIMNHYNSAISQRLAKQEKWSADLRWMESDQLNSEMKTETEKFDLEKQILDDNLESLQQGVLVKWPK
jgi:hypothetical protein